MRDAGIGSWPERQRRVRPDAPAIRFEGRTTTHAGFAERVRAAAAALAGLGVGPGDRVGCVSANHPAVLESLLACARLGAVWVPVDGRLTVPGITYVLADAGVVVVLHGREHGTRPRWSPRCRSCPASRPPPSSACRTSGGARSGWRSSSRRRGRAGRGRTAHRPARAAGRVQGARALPLH
ncbi:AMP-binding protein [Modestobacter sp. I12A-02628]|uniref:Long-chain fatty acid--CoA ligase n=1 Tax=Goekera deserti TaxID=2497753 RepID=A0A7K3WHB1_9ACTN|nr:AMP-binding protein [Goekera deserti]NDI48511.1 AMP-binding protein [Goekera deserti]NEL55110.1 long-chain fatty acid--CoA ligase [Goekera deserti]